MSALKQLVWISTMMSSILADAQDPNSAGFFTPEQSPSPSAIAHLPPSKSPEQSPSDSNRRAEQIVRAIALRQQPPSQQSCGVAIYQVSNFDGESSVEGGLAYLAHEHGHHHIFDGVLNAPVEHLKLKTLEIQDYRFILEGYLENHFCDEAHLYMNLPNKGEFGKIGEVTGKTEKDESKKKETEAAIEKNVQEYFHENAIFQKALPAVLRNLAFKKLVVHRVVGFTHASWAGLAEDPKQAIDKTEIYSEALTDIFKKVHIMDPVEFDLEEYRKQQKIQICQTNPEHAACSDATNKNKDWHTVAFSKSGQPKANLPYKTKGITDFIDSMLCGLAEEYQNTMRSPDTGKGAASFKAIWQQSQKKTRGQAYKNVVQGTSFDADLTHVAAQEEWPSVVSSVATRVKMGMSHADSASTYEKYVVGSDISRFLPLLALGIPFLMYR